MIIEFTLDENDFLTHQLFVASKSERVNKQRKRSRLAGPIVQAAFGILFLVDLKIVPGIIFLCLAPVWYFIYPLWDRKYHFRHYKGFIRENFKEKLNKPMRIELTDEFILAKENLNEGKVPLSEVTEINEIPTVLFIRINGGKAFVIPKNKATNTDQLVPYLKDLAARLNIKYDHDENWEWK